MGLPVVKRGEIWEVDFEPQTHKEEPGKRRRPALVIQTDLLNGAKHPTTIVIPGTTDTYRDKAGDGFPLRVPIGRPGSMKEETDLLIDQIRTISNHRFLEDKPVATLATNHMKRVMEALKLLTSW
jgi:mRNA interferase MazF